MVLLFCFPLNQSSEIGAHRGPKNRENFLGNRGNEDRVAESTIFGIDPLMTFTVSFVCRAAGRCC